MTSSALRRAVPAAALLALCLPASAQAQAQPPRGKNERTTATEWVEPEPGSVTAVDGPPPAGSALELDTTLPDPKPKVTAERWLIDLRYRHGDPRLVDVRRADRHWPAPTPRVFGRFALEAYHEGELLERVRFDFPMVQEPAARRGRGGLAALDFERRLNTRIGVFFPVIAEMTRFELVDRATGRRWRVPLPAATPR